jgi:glycosyltransferase involved in cell wall biosynthesis
MAEVAILAGVVLLGAGLWSWRLGTLFRARARGEDSERGRVLPVSIIVPARNEAHNLPGLLASLKALDPRPLEIVVVDDHSTDGTGDIARAAGVHVVSPPPLPAGWNGKPWACRTGASEARGEYLLFTDADTVHAPGSLGQAMAALRARDAALLSAVPTHIVRAAWEKLQGVFQLLLLVATRAGATEATSAAPRAAPDAVTGAAPGAVTGAGAGGASAGKAGQGGARGGAHERRFSIGQYLLFRRDAYERIGGHEPVKQRIAEDLAFARLIADVGLGLGLVFSPGLLGVRMYPEGLGAFVRGWRRNFREGLTAAGAGGVLEIAAIIGWLLGAPMAALSAAAAGLAPLALGWAAVYLATAIEVARRQRSLGAFPLWSGLLYPVFVLMFVLVTALALIDRWRGATVIWRGRAAVPGGESTR